MKKSKNKMALPENSDIYRIFLTNKDSSSHIWMENLFVILRPLVISRIKKFKNFSHLDDLKQEFYVALWTAIKTFDYQKHFDFYRWANWYFISASRDFQKKYQPIRSINLDNSGVETQYNIALVKEILNCKTLTSIEKNIINMTILKDMTLSDAGNKLGLSAERIRLLRKRAIFKMKEYGEWNDRLE